MTTIIGYVNGVPIYSDTSSSEVQSISGSTLTAAQILQLLQELASKQVTGATETDSTAWTFTWSTTSTSSSFPTTATGNPSDDLYTLWVMLASIQGGGASAADIDNMIEFIGSMYQMGDFDANSDGSASVISAFFSSDNGQALEKGLIDAAMMQYTLQYITTYEATNGVAPSPLQVSTAVSAYADELETQLSSMGVPDTDEMMQELGNWDSDSASIPYMYESFGLEYTTVNGVGTWVLSANSTMNPTDTAVAINTDTLEAASDAVFWSETFANASFASCTTELYDELLDIAASGNMFDQPTTDLELAMEFIELEMSGLTSQIAWLTAEGNEVNSILDEFTNTTTTGPVIVEDTNGDGSYTSTTTVSGDFGSYTTVYDSETNTTTVTYGDGTSGSTEPSADQQTAAMNFMTDLQNLYINVNNYALADTSGYSTIVSNVDEAYETIFNLPLYNADGTATGQTLGEAYADDDEVAVAEGLSYYQGTDDGTDVTNSLTSLVTTFTDVNSAVQTQYSTLAKKDTAITSTLGVYLLKTEKSISDTAVSNMAGTA